MTRLKTNELHASSKIKLDFPSSPVLGVCWPVQGPWVPSLGREGPHAAGQLALCSASRATHSEEDPTQPRINKQD